MLGWAITFVLLALVAGVLGFGGLAGAATNIAYICLVVFLFLAVVSFLRRTA